MRYAIRHETEYRYAEPATLQHGLGHLRPRDLPYQTRLDHSLHIDPEPHDVSERKDFFGNPTVFFTLDVPHDRLLVTSHATVELRPRPTPTDPAGPAWEAVRDALRADITEAGRDAFQFTFDSPLAWGLPELWPLVAESFTPSRPIFEAARELTERIHDEFTFDPTATDVTTPVAEVFANRRGVCQDFAHLMIAALRTLGLPARYVSGYLRTEPPPGQPRLIGADASHAWVSVFAPEPGGGSCWLDLDPTNHCVAGMDHVTLAWGRDFADVTPLKGMILGGGRHTVEARVDLAPVDDATKASPSASKPER